MERPCDMCQQIFDTATRNLGKGRQRFCSKACRSTAHNKQHWRRRNPPAYEGDMAKLCVVCGVGFQADAHHPSALTCSIACNNARQNAARRRRTAFKYDVMPEKECAECGSLFKPHAFATSVGKYCSGECARKFRVRDSGRKRAKLFGQYNKRLASASWKEARAIVLERDGRRCRICKVSKNGMSVHHLFDPNDHSEDNLITACRQCHHDLHSFSLKKVDGKVVIAGGIFKYLGLTNLEVEQNGEAKETRILNGQ